MRRNETRNALSGHERGRRALALGLCGLALGLACAVADSTRSDAAPPSEEAAGLAKKAAPSLLPPELPWEERRRCERDQDCVLLPPRPCSCSPCGDVWREALNRSAAEELRARWSKRRCVQPACEACEGRYVGSEARCIDAQCVVR